MFATFLVACAIGTTAAASPITTRPATTAPATTSPTTAPSTQPAAPPPPQAPFSLAGAATQGESVAATLRGINAQLNNGGQLSDIEQETPVLSSEINNRLAESASLLASHPSLQLLQQQEIDWTEIEHTLADWKGVLQQRGDRLNQATDQISHLAATWDQEQQVVDYWLKHAKHTDLLSAAEASVAKTRAQIVQTSTDLHNARIRLFAIEQAIDTQNARVLDVLDSVQQARDEAFNRLLVHDSPPLWNLFRSRNAGGEVALQGQDSLSRQVNEVRDYLSQRRELLAGLVVLLLVLASVLLWIRRRIQKWCQETPQLAEATRVFASPIATALVLSLLFTAWIFPRAPRLLSAAIEAAALIPTVIILRRLIDRRWFTALNALVVFYFLDQIRLIAAAIPELVRTLLLIEMAGGAALILAILHPPRRDPQKPPVAKPVRWVAYLLLVVFSVALIADVLGYVSLANLLGDAALGSAYTAVVFYAGARIISGFLTIALHSRFLTRLQLVREHHQLILRRLNMILFWIASAAWLWGVLSILSIAPAAWDLAHRILTANLSYGQISVSLGNVLIFAFTIWLSVQMSRFVRFVLEEDVYERFTLPSGIPYAISKMLNYVILLIGFFVAVSALGYDMTKFTILVGAFGVGLGFGMQNIVNNFVSGLILLFERPVKVGDLIQMGDTTGVVKHIGIRASIIRTPNSAEIIIPNGNLISNQVTNWTLSNRQRGIEIKVAVGPSAKPMEVIELLKKTAAAHKRITDNPPPEAFLIDFSADAFNYELHAWTNSAEEWVQIRSDLAVAIHDVLVALNISLR
ncbi:MAG: mechanosensitive ion channel domain-containing protein [Tepidisphaeraceae bacterium]|jgi:small-conductance mechanosensitive channel